MGSLAHEGLLQRLGVHGQILHGLHIGHVLDQYHRVPVHIHQHIPFLHGGDVPQQVEGALVLRLHHVEDHDAPLQLPGNLMLVAQGLQLRAGQVAPKHPAVHVIAVFRMMIGFRHGGNQRTGQGQHIKRARRLRRAAQHHRRLLHRQVQTAVRRCHHAVLQRLQLHLRADVIFLIQHGYRNGQPRQD